jgi:hypothetical protein
MPTDQSDPAFQKAVNDAVAKALAAKEKKAKEPSTVKELIDAIADRVIERLDEGESGDPAEGEGLTLVDKFFGKGKAS